MTHYPSNPFQYTGRENDETGLYYYRARYYNPTLQRFLSEDPILAPFMPLAVGLCRLSNVTLWLLPAKVRIGDPEAPKFMNGFAYALNNPVRQTDPSGLIPQKAPCSDAIQQCFDAANTNAKGAAWVKCMDDLRTPYEERCRGKSHNDPEGQMCAMSNFVSAGSTCTKYADHLPDICIADTVTRSCQQGN